MLNNYKHIFFVGIGGIGMSSLDLYCLKKGKYVGGYDRQKTYITTNLENQGANIQYTTKTSLIPINFKFVESTLVIYTPAIPRNNLIFNFFKSNKFKILKRSDFLGSITKNKFCIAIAGTHGKTTTASILSHIFFENNLNFSSFIGGIMEKYETNFIYRGEDIILVEADEFDRSFLSLKPNIACVTSIDIDHLDIYKSSNEIINSFQEFISNVDSSGLILKQYDLNIDGISFGFNENADFHIKNYRNFDDFSLFDIIYSEGKCANIKFNMSGMHNALNALAAFSVCKNMNLSDLTIKKSLNNFKGVKRRFSYVLKYPKIIIDDYAHHPTEISAVYQSLLSIYPQKKILAIFQPHLFSRTKDFMDDFAEKLSKFNEVILLDIYPAREQEIKGINSNKLLQKINIENKNLVEKNDLSKHIMKSKCDVIVIMGAGDIADEVSLIKNEILINHEL